MNQAVGAPHGAKAASRPWMPYVVVSLLAAAGAATTPYVISLSTRAETKSPPQNLDPPRAANDISRGADSSPLGVVEMPTSQWESCGIRLERASLQTLATSIRLTGKVSLNEDKVAHIYPLVEGTVDEVLVGLGQVVKANDLLVVVHSREVGKAKLELYQARQQHEMAVVKQNLQEGVANNARELLNALRNGESIDAIEGRFRNRSMGDYRERLLLAYAGFLKSEADVERLEGPAQSGAISAKQLYAAQSSKSSDQATFQARIEQIDYELQTSLLSSSQAVKEAATRVAVATTNLRILGCDEEDIASIDPEQQGETVSHYSIRAPFDGTVVAKDVTLKEQVRPDTQIFSIADLSTVWVTADIYEQHVPLLAAIAGKPVRVCNEAWPDQDFVATVFYTGEIMDESTRTISMRAIAKNDEHLLKPGMFVTIEFEADSGDKKLGIPPSAIQQHGGKDFVFVHVSGDKFEPREVVLGDRSRSVVQIKAGLNEGNAVVVEGGFILKSKMLESQMGEG
ncbi:Cobalt-zinc-cadmium resistance protein CzcB [Botrimarina mediterranea]|uniref:Cobalt-zinc-cadmium resistance protein CzcB n=2 Tax=Botrimarina mediterranea TaxID=2528022 RepID=A0A518KE55_9BACT|nr:Cobalt-zinc-cadmium resistance protein CzcB [Botrimarina mediterranea]